LLLNGREIICQSADCVNKGGFFMPDNKCNECGHQHDHDYDEMDNIIELTGENGETIQVEFLATVKVDDQEYAIMQTLDDYDDEDTVAEIVIMRLEYDDNDDEYYLIAEEDEDVQQRVFEAFHKSALEEEE